MRYYSDEELIEALKKAIPVATHIEGRNDKLVATAYIDAVIERLEVKQRTLDFLRNQLQRAHQEVGSLYMNNLELEEGY